MKGFDTTGQRCALIGKACPGRGIFHPKGGCPEWVDGEAMDRTVDGKVTSEIFRGCQRLMFRPLMRGVTVAVHEQAASFDQARNHLAKVGESSYAALMAGAAAAVERQIAGGEGVRSLPEDIEAIDVPDEVRDARGVS